MLTISQLNSFKSQSCTDSLCPLRDEKTLRSSNFDQQIDCEYFHSDFDRRRRPIIESPPLTLLYTHDFKDQTNGKGPQNRFEHFYHPNFYKSKLCEVQNCKCRYCPFYHLQQEKNIYDDVRNELCKPNCTIEKLQQFFKEEPQKQEPLNDRTSNQYEEQKIGDFGFRSNLFESLFPNEIIPFNKVEMIEQYNGIKIHEDLLTMNNDEIITDANSTIFPIKDEKEDDHELIELVNQIPEIKNSKFQAIEKAQQRLRTLQGLAAQNKEGTNDLQKWLFPEQKKPQQEIDLINLDKADPEGFKIPNFIVPTNLAPKIMLEEFPPLQNKDNDINPNVIHTQNINFFDLFPASNSIRAEDKKAIPNLQIQQDLPLDLFIQQPRGISDHTKSQLPFDNLDLTINEDNDLNVLNGNPSNQSIFFE